MSRLEEGNVKMLISSVVLLALNVGWAAAPELFSLEIKDAPVENGKAMTWTFHEIERRPTSSIIEVVTETGASISGFTFLIRGMCGMAKARGEQFFTAKELSRSPVRIEVLFQKTAPDPASLGRLDPGEQKVFSMAECDMVESMMQNAPPNNRMQRSGSR